MLPSSVSSVLPGALRMTGGCERDEAMVGARLKVSTLAVALIVAGASARAADYPQPQPYPMPQPQPIIIQQPVVQEFAASWYLRGDIGMTNQQISKLTNVLDGNNRIQNIGLGFDSSPLFGLGVGYYFNDWLRFDLTGEYRGRANFHGTQVITGNNYIITDEYSGSKSEWLFLANAYVDLGTWNGFTPFVGAGIGGARVTIHGLRDVCSVCPGTGAAVGPGVAFGDDVSKWNFAWALHAGLAYKVTKNFTVEFAYRYVDLGDAVSGDLYTYLGTNNVVNPMEFKHLTSHDFKVGLRFNLDGMIEYSRPQVIYSQPPPVYAPPVYAPPPLRSRG